MLDYHSLKKSINAIHNGNSVISYHLLPNITDLLASLQKLSTFSFLDLRSGYHHISIALEAKLKTAFATARGRWHWSKPPSGTCSVLGIFCYFVSQVLSVLDFCFAYLDDILVYSMSWKEHLLHLEMVFKHLKEANLKIKLSKFQFFRENLHCLGHLISEHGIQPLPEKVLATENLKGTQ